MYLYVLERFGQDRAGYLGSVIHIAVEAVGNPLRLLLTAGQRHDSPQAGALIEGYEPQALIADKGYDSDPLIESVTSNGIRRIGWCSVHTAGTCIGSAT